jgi:hypothetical protein
MSNKLLFLGLVISSVVVVNIHPRALHAVLLMNRLVILSVGYHWAVFDLRHCRSKSFCQRLQLSELCISAILAMLRFCAYLTVSRELKIYNMDFPVSEEKVVTICGAGLNGCLMAVLLGT